jgi:hypothetical protein
MTKLEYLQRLPETYNGLPLRQMALENYDATFSPVFNCIDLHHALCVSFRWNTTQQLYGYWERMAREAKRGELKIIDNQIKMEL